MGNSEPLVKETEVVFVNRLTPTMRSRRTVAQYGHEYPGNSRSRSFPLSRWEHLASLCTLSNVRDTLEAQIFRHNVVTSFSSHHFSPPLHLWTLYILTFLLFFCTNTCSYPGWDWFGATFLLFHWSTLLHRPIFTYSYFLITSAIQWCTIPQLWC